MTTDGQGDVDLDLYADVEGGEFSHEGGYEDNQNENGTDLFDDVIVPSANNDFPDLNGHSSGNTKPIDPPINMAPNYPGKRVSCYVGNLTWWTTDQDLTDAIIALGITDLIEIKFYENKVNGQSKG
jgi:cleavage and polyadenylation specificity factor subunit 6/7